MTDWADVKKVPGRTVMGLDISTKSIAFAIFRDGKPLRCGEIFIYGSDMYEQAQDAQRKVTALTKAGILEGDYIAIESAVFVNNMAVALKMATVFGAVVGSLDGKVYGFKPLEWQSFIGNPNYKKADKDAFKLANPGKTETWYKAQIREIRKQKTLAFARQFFPVQSGSDNVGDAIGVAYFCVKEKVS